MSVDFMATALIGVELDIDKTSKMIRERGCEHEESKSKFCAQCGFFTWYERGVVIEELRMQLDDEDDEDECYSDEIILEDYKLAFTTDQNRVFLGKQVSTYGDDEAKMIELPVREEIGQDIAYIKQSLLDFLKPLDLWDENKFGIWTIAHVSY
ncbi:hypothetical protein LCGC14_1318880 [marine sediment metagenome]|uniref:Uncharacterized protein n=1 Tax=marine sediment metagenome TaxID=412755 RepID=A0A0F9KKL8_9ZZZZ